MALRSFGCCIATIRAKKTCSGVYPDISLMSTGSKIVDDVLLQSFQIPCMRMFARRISAFSLRRVVRRMCPSVLHVHFLHNALDVLPLVDINGLPILVTAHGSDVNRAPVNKQYRRQLEVVFDAVTCVIGVSDFICDQLVRLGCPKRKVRRIYLGALLPHAIMRSHCPQGTTRVVSVGSLVAAKGHEYLLQALALAKGKEPRLSLCLVSDGALRCRLAALADRLGLGRCVRFTGWLEPSRVYEVLANSDIYAQHSVKVHIRHWLRGEHLQEEALGISFVEAAACGLPLIGTYTGGVPEICRDGYNGYLVHQCDVEAMAQRIVALARDEGLRRHLGDNGRALAQQEFDIQKQTAKLEGLYDEILSRRVSASERY